MRISTFLATTLAVSAGVFSGVGIASAVRLADGTVYFAHPPSLVSATTTFNDVYVWGARYYFTISIPEDAGEPLQLVTITQQEGLDNIEYNLDDSRAVVETSRRKRERITLGSVTRDRKKRMVSIAFDPPIPPGKTVTIELNPVHNPRYDGVYLFGVTAFPPGEKTHGQFLGFGRLHFYDNRDFSRH